MLSAVRTFLFSFAGLTFGALCATGCAGDDTTLATLSGGGANTAGSTTGTGTGATTATAATSGSSGSGVCGAKDADASDPCEICALESCAEARSACCAISAFTEEGKLTSGCLAVTACVFRTGCEHAACYAPDTCKAEIDGAGGISGDGIVKAGALGECLGPAIVGAATNACAECKAKTM